MINQRIALVTEIIATCSWFLSSGVARGVLWVLKHPPQTRRGYIYHARLNYVPNDYISRSAMKFGILLQMYLAKWHRDLACHEREPRRLRSQYSLMLAYLD